MKKVLFALIAALLVDCVVWSLQWTFLEWVPEFRPAVGLMGLTLLVWLLMLVSVGTWAARRWGKGWLERVGVKEVGATELFVVGCCCCFFDGLRRGQSTLDFQLHDTIFVFASWHFQFATAIIFWFLMTVYVAFPRLTGRRLQGTLGLIHFWGSFAGLFLLLPMTAYQARRYMDYRTFTGVPWTEWAVWCVLLFLAAQVVLLVNLGYSVVWGRKIH